MFTSLKKMKRMLVISLLLSIIALVFLMFISNGFNAFNEISKLSLSRLVFFMGLAFGLHIGSWFIWALRIKMMSKDLGFHVDYKRALHIVMANVFLAALTPSNMGGEPLRIQMLKKDTNGSGNASAVTIVERIYDAIFVVMMVPLVLYVFLKFTNMNVENLLIYIFAGEALLIFIVLYIVRFLWKHHKRGTSIYRFKRVIGIFVRDKTKLHNLLAKWDGEFHVFISQSMNLLSKKKKKMIVYLPLTALMWTFEFLVASCILMAIGLDANVLFTFGAQILIIVVAIFSPTPGGSGTSEIITGLLYIQLVPTTLIALYVFLWRAVIYYFNIIIGLVFIIKEIKTNGEDDE